METFGRVENAVPRARLDGAERKTIEWQSSALHAYQRRTKRADSLIARAYLAGPNTRRVRGPRGRVWRRGRAGCGGRGL